MRARAKAAARRVGASSRLRWPTRVPTTSSDPSPSTPDAAMRPRARAAASTVGGCRAKVPGAWSSSSRSGTADSACRVPNARTQRTLTDATVSVSRWSSKSRSAPGVRPRARCFGAHRPARVGEQRPKGRQSAADRSRPRPVQRAAGCPRPRPPRTSGARGSRCASIRRIAASSRAQGQSRAGGEQSSKQGKQHKTSGAWTGSNGAFPSDPPGPTLEPLPAGQGGGSSTGRYGTRPGTSGSLHVALAP